MKEELMELIRNMVADDEMELTEDSEFVDDLGLSSMEFFNLISQVEGQFHVKFTDREIQNLMEVSDHYPKYVVTLDEYAGGNVNGIRIIHMCDFLLQENF